MPLTTHDFSVPLSLDPIDLTTQDDDLQKALALSIQEMQKQQGGGMVQESTNISLEDQELSRLWESPFFTSDAPIIRWYHQFFVFVSAGAHERSWAPGIDYMYFWVM